MPRPVQRKKSSLRGPLQESRFFLPFVLTYILKNGFPGGWADWFLLLGAAAADRYGRTNAALEPLGLVLFGKDIFRTATPCSKKIFADLALGRNAVVTAAVPAPPLPGVHTPAQFVLFHLAAQHRFPVCGPLVRLAVDNVGWSDRLIEQCNAVEAREMESQLLDNMDLGGSGALPSRPVP